MYIARHYESAALLLVQTPKFKDLLLRDSKHLSILLQCQPVAGIALVTSDNKLRRELKLSMLQSILQVNAHIFIAFSQNTNYIHDVASKFKDHENAEADARDFLLPIKQSFNLIDLQDSNGLGASLTKRFEEHVKMIAEKLTSRGLEPLTNTPQATLMF